MLTASRGAGGSRRAIRRGQAAGIPSQMFATAVRGLAAMRPLLVPADWLP